MIFTAKPRHSHAVFAFWVYQPNPSVLPFLLMQNQSPKDIAGSNLTNTYML